MADVGCCKYSMFFVNLLVFLGGACLLAVGIWVAVGAESFKDVITNDPVVFNAVYVIIAVGCILIIVGFLGCCGAAKENRCMLATFFALILILFIIEIVGGVLAFVFYPRAKEAALSSMNRYNGGTEEDQIITAGWQLLQETFECCGLNGFQDWLAAGVFVPPKPCVRIQIPPVPGCVEALTNYFWVLGGIACGILVIEILAMIFACCLYQNVK